MLKKFFNPSYIDITKQKDMRKENIEFKYIDVSSIDRDFYKIVGFTLHKGKTSPSRARKIVKTNDVIIATVRPTLKRIALVSEDYDNEICSTAFCVLRANKDKLNPKFLYYSTQRPLFFDALESIQRGASYPAVTDSDIKKQKIAYTNLACQQEISEILSAVDSKIEQEENKKKALEELFKSMLHNLMSAKIRVKDIENQNI
jgi:type I restriction enzyme S subunit